MFRPINPATNVPSSPNMQKAPDASAFQASINNQTLGNALQKLPQEVKNMILEDVLGYPEAVTPADRLNVFLTDKYHYKTELPAQRAHFSAKGNTEAEVAEGNIQRFLAEVFEPEARAQRQEEDQFSGFSALLAGSRQLFEDKKGRLDHIYDTHAFLQKLNDILENYYNQAGKLEGNGDRQGVEALKEGIRERMGLLNASEKIASWNNDIGHPYSQLALSDELATMPASEKQNIIDSLSRINEQFQDNSIISILNEDVSVDFLTSDRFHNLESDKKRDFLEDLEKFNVMYGEDFYLDSYQDKAINTLNNNVDEHRSQLIALQNAYVSNNEDIIAMMSDVISAASESDTRINPEIAMRAFDMILSDELQSLTPQQQDNLSSAMQELLELYRNDSNMVTRGTDAFHEAARDAAGYISSGKFLDDYGVNEPSSYTDILAEFKESINREVRGRVFTPLNLAILKFAKTDAFANMQVDDRVNFIDNYSQGKITHEHYALIMNALTEAEAAVRQEVRRAAHSPENQGVSHAPEGELRAGMGNVEQSQAAPAASIDEMLDAFINFEPDEPSPQ